MPRSYAPLRRLRIALAFTCGLVAGLGSTGAFAQSSEPDPTSPFLPIRVLTEVTYPVTGGRYLLTSVTDYLNAAQFAEDQGGWLWAVNDEDEYNFVLDAILPAWERERDTFIIPAGFSGAGTNGVDGDIYIGFNDSEFFGASEGNFQWINGDPVTFENWSGGEPNNVGQDLDPSGEDYAEITSVASTRFWNDDNDRGSGLNGLPPIDPFAARLPGGGGNMSIVELPPVPPPMTLQIDLSTGVAQLRSDIENPLQLFSYDIASETGALNADAWETTNLGARSVDSTDDSQPGQSWDAAFASEELLIEGFLFGSSEISAGETLVLGQIIEPLADGADAPVITASAAHSNPNPEFAGIVTSLGLPVEFVSIAVPGDYNGDGGVDAADYTVWRDGLPAADGNGDGVVDDADYLVWRNHYGLASSAPASLGVPEPGAAALVVLLAVTAVTAVTAARR